MNNPKANLHSPKSQKPASRKLIFCIVSILFLIQSGLVAQKMDSLAALLEQKNLPDSQRVKIMLEIGKVKAESGDSPTAIKLYLQCLELAKQGRDTAQMVKSLHLICRQYIRNTPDTTQLSFFAEKFLQTATAWGKPKQLAHAHRFAGVALLLKLEDYVKHSKPFDHLLSPAISHFQKADSIFQSIGEMVEAANAFAKIGDAYNSVGMPEKAVPYYLNLMEKANVARDSFQLMSACIQIGTAFLAQKKPENLRQSIPFLQNGYQLARQQGSMYEAIYSSGKLAEAHAALGNFEKAYHFEDIYSTLNDSILNQEKVKQLVEVEGKYASQLKETEVAQKNLELEQQANVRNNLLFAAVLALLGGAAYFFWRRKKSEIKEKQAQLQAQIEHAEAEKLRELDHFKTQFFTNISHEFRTPLTVILGNVDLMKNKISAELQDNLQAVHRNGEVLLRLINQILDLAKLEVKSLKINYLQSDIVSFVNYLAESFQSFANAQNLIVRVENRSGQSQILMDFDRERMTQILQNLISNALKFTPSGGRVEVNIGRVSDPSNVLQIQVSDTGAGIPPEDLPHIFDRFFQAKNQRSEGGTGIGLALTKELVGLFGGEISVESELGKGTIFTVRLPISQNAPLEMSAPVASIFTRSEVAPPANDLSKNAQKSALPKLLIVEDNPDVVEYLTQCLEKNYSLEFAFNGRSGIEKAVEIVPDLIVSDVMMPEKDGFELTEFLKNDERTSHVPIVLLTARATVEDRILGLRRGADGYLAKPFHPEELDATLEKLLENRRRWQAHFAKIAIEPASSLPRNLPAADVEIEDLFLTKIRTVVEESMGDVLFSPELVCRKIGMSQTNLNLKMNALTGMPISIYIRTLRLQKAQKLLLNPALNISEVAYEVGFSDPKYFTRIFSEEFGSSPSDFRKLQLNA